MFSISVQKPVAFWLYSTHIHIVSLVSLFHWRSSMRQMCCALVALLLCAGRRSTHCHFLKPLLVILFSLNSLVFTETNKTFVNRLVSLSLLQHCACLDALMCLFSGRQFSYCVTVQVSACFTHAPPMRSHAWTHQVINSSPASSPAPRHNTSRRLHWKNSLACSLLLQYWCHDHLKPLFMFFGAFSVLLICQHHH